MRVAASILALATAVALALPARAGDELSPARERELRHLVLQDCGSCHGLTMKGGLGAPLLPSALADKPDDALVAIIRDGIPGTPMPPWRDEISQAEASWIVEQLRKGLSHER